MQYLLQARLLTVLFCLFCYTTLFAQSYTLSGTISNAATGEMLTGATVTVKGTFNGSTSNAQGVYTITHLKAGSYILQVAMLGFTTLEQVLTIDQNIVFNFELKPENRLLDEVIVRGLKANPNTASTYTNLSKADIEPLNKGQDLPFLLQQTPSLVVTSDAGAGVGYTGMRIRGTDATRINVTLNGIPLNDAESHSVFWVNMPDFASSVDNIQIQRGVGTSVNGAAAFGASVNVQTSQLKPEAYAGLNTSGGSFNTQRYNIQFGTGLLNEHFALDARLSSITSDGYIDRASSNLKSFFISGGYYGKKSTLKAIVFGGKEITYQAWGGVPENLLKTQRTYNVYTYNNQVDNYQQNHYQLHFSHGANSNWQINTALHYTQGKGYYEEYQPQQNLSDYGLQNTDVYHVQINGTDSLFTLITQTDLIRRKWLDNYFYGGVFTINYNPNKKLHATLGGGANHYKGQHFGEVIWAQFAANSNIRHRYYESKGNKTDANLFVKTEYQISPNWGLFADLQYRYIDYSIAGTDEVKGKVNFNLKYHFLNPKAGITYNFSESQQAYTSFGVSHREPTRNNLIDNDTRPFSERLSNVETGYKYTQSRFVLNANYYYMHYKNQLVLTGNLNNVGYPIQQNVAQSYRTGIEINTILKPGTKLEIQANLNTGINKIKHFNQTNSIYTSDFTYLRDTLLSYRDADISFSPNIIAGTGITYRPFTWGTAAVFTNYVGRQFLDNTGNANRALPSYIVSNLLLSCNFQAKWFKNIELSLLINNLFNSLYESNGWTYFLLFQQDNKVNTENYNNYYPQAGINTLIGLKINI